MNHFHYEPCRQKPGYFFSYSLAPLFVEAAQILFNRFIFWINVKAVLSEFSRYTWHVRRLPCKDIPVLTDELDERAFLFGIEVSADSELLGRISWHKINLLGLLCRFKLQRRIMLC